MGCDAKGHESYEAAMTARWVIAQNRSDIDTSKLRPEKCDACGKWHLRRLKVEPITQRHNHYFECMDCGHEWLAPSGHKCPKCFSLAIENRGNKRCDYVRA